MSSSVIPDYIYPIIGYRAWNWDTKDLKSFNGNAWFPNHAMAAKCPIDCNHACPVEDCSCGVYAAKNYRHLQLLLNEPESVLQGEVYLWGKVVEHELGYRAQFAYPKSFVLPAKTKRSLTLGFLKSLLVYGVDICTPENVLLWRRGLGCTIKGSSWLGQKRKWPTRTRIMGRNVNLIGRGMGVIESYAGTDSLDSNCVEIKLRNKDVYVVPQDDIVANSEDSGWEVDLSKYRNANVLRSDRGFRIICRPRPENCSNQTKSKSANLMILQAEELATSHPPCHISVSCGVCSVCGSSAVYFDNWRDIHVCGKCGSHCPLTNH